jgi:hypothetical protein
MRKAERVGGEISTSQEARGRGNCSFLKQLL